MLALANIPFYVIFLSQILLISFYLPRKMLNRIRYVFETYPPSEFPKLYPKPIEYYEKARRNYRNMNVCILLAGLLLLAVRLGYSRRGEWDVGNIVSWYFMVQFFPMMLIFIGSFKHYKLMRKMDARTTRKAELRPRRLFDFISPTLIGMAMFVYFAFIVFVLYIKQFDFPWFGGYWNIVAVTAGNLCFAGIIVWYLYGKKRDPYQAYEDRIREIELVVKQMVFISIAATLFIAIEIVLASLDLRHLQPTVSSLYFQLIAVISLRTLPIDTINFEVYKFAKTRKALEKRNINLENRVSQRTEELAEANRALEVQNTQLVEAKEAAEAANRAKSTFLANMSHEIRTPLNAILGYAQILQRDGGLQPNQQNAIETIDTSGRNLLALINEILDLSKIEAGQMELQPTDFDLAALIEGLGAMFAIRCEQKGIGWRVQWVSGEPKEGQIRVHGDEGKLRQVLINLLGNAVKFTSEGTVTLKIDLATKVSFDVIDTGVGITESEQEQILSPFTQGEAGTTSGGTGLGLAIAQKHIEMMGGQLFVESTPSAGSRFWFTIPLQAALSEAAEANVSLERTINHLAEGHHVNALIADDVAENREVLEQILTPIGVQVRTVESGVKAISAVKAEKPDLVFMDIRMPEMSGIQAAEHIWEEVGHGAMKIVAISASTLTHERQKYLDTGFDAFIPKPFLAQEVYDCLANLLHVEYEYTTDETFPQTLSRVVLPEDLFLRLKHAAELGEVTRLEEYLEEVSQMSEAGQNLAAELLQLCHDLDMDAILEILEECRER